MFVQQSLSGLGGAISITGTGGNSTGQGNAGIGQTAAIINTGTGSITLNGTGGGSGTSEIGLYSNAAIRTGTGAISLTGTASATASGGGSYGVLIQLIGVQTGPAAAP